MGQPDARPAERAVAKETATSAPTGQPSAKSTQGISEAPASELSEGTAGSSAARPMVVAFTARIRPVVEATPDAPGGEQANGVSDPVKAQPGSDKDPTTGETPPGGQENSHGAPAAPNRQPEGREPDRKADVSAAAAPEPAAVARPADTPQPPAASGAQPRISNPAPPPPAAAAEPVTAPETPKATAAHDIKLELAGQGDQRVEVRVSERAGDMRVEVRTPDTGLAGDLREDLPALASKLEQTGFHADTWHPAGPAERQGTAETAPGGASQDSERHGQNGGQQQRDQQPQARPKVSENDTPSPDAGKDFSWLFSSIQ